MEPQKCGHMISVIVPIYNAQKYLAVMIESLRHQSYAKWELILVDNGSRDGSVEICTMYENRDRRICVVQERKKGVSAARNSGLKMARGEYILFVDADDFLPDSNVLERLVTTIQLTKADIVVGNYVRLWNGQQLKAASHEAFSKENPDSEDFRFQGFFSVGTLSYAWGKLYRRQFLNQNKISFEDIMYAEDKLFNMECYLNHPQYAFLPDVVYVYRKNDQSVSFHYRVDSRECWLTIAYKLRDFFRKYMSADERKKYQGFIYYLLFFACFFDAKMEYVQNRHSLRAVVRLLKEYQADQLVNESFIRLTHNFYTGQLSSRFWKIMIKGFCIAMRLHLYYGLAIGIKLLIDGRVDERLSDTGLRE